MSGADGTGQVVLGRVHEYSGESAVTVLAWPSLSAGHLSAAEQRMVVAEWLDFFGRPSPIEDLTLWCRVSDTLMAVLASQTRLRRLVLQWGPYTDLGAVEAMPELRSLTLGGASALTDLSPLTGLDKLENVEIEGARRLRDYSPLGQVPSLQTVVIDRSFTGARTDAESLEFVRSLPGLRLFHFDPRVASGDYSPLLTLTGAEEVGVTATRGMTPSMADLEWALPGMQAFNRKVADHRIPLFSSTGETTVIARDVTGRTVFVPPEPEEVLAQPDDVFDHEPMTGWVSGTTVRVFSQTARTRIERFKLTFDVPHQEASLVLAPEEKAIASFPFSGEAEDPLLIWDEPVHRAPHNDAAPDTFEGNLDVQTGPPPWSVTVDASDMLPLRDDDFWPLIDSLKGRTNLMAVERMATHLAEHDEQFIQRWAQTLALKALDLVPALERLNSAHTVHPAQIRSALGATIGRGRHTHRNVIADPSTFDPRWLKGDPYELIGAGFTALHRQRPEVGKLVTAFTIWCQAPEQQPIRHYLEDTDVSDLIDGLTCARAHVVTEHAVRERLVIFNTGGIDGRQLGDAARDAIELFGGVTIAGPELTQHGAQLEHLATVFTTRRRSTLPETTYLNRYSSGTTK